jgi:hypothetical protein
MAVSSSVDPERPGAPPRSIRSSFAVRVAVPATCLAVLWVLGLTVAFRTAPGETGAGGPRRPPGRPGWTWPARRRSRSPDGARLTRGSRRLAVRRRCGR